MYISGLPSVHSTQFSFFFQDFYLDLTEDNRRITPRDYLEIALRPVDANGRDIAAKNQVS